MLRHDLRHSLYVLDLSLRLIEGRREDPAQFSETLELVRQEHDKIAACIERLLAGYAAPGADNGRVLPPQ